MTLRPARMYWKDANGVTYRSLEPVDAQPLMVGVPCLEGCPGFVDSIHWTKRRYSCTGNGRTYHANPERISQVRYGELVILSSDGRKIERVQGEPLKRSHEGAP